MFAQDGLVNLTIGGWSEALEELYQRISGRFARSEARERVKRYLLGLLGRGVRLLCTDIQRLIDNLHLDFIPLAAIFDCSRDINHCQYLLRVDDMLVVKT